MKFSVISAFPKFIEAVIEDGVIGSALKHNVLELQIINPREFATNSYQRIDDRAFGGTDGMVMMPEPLAKAIGKAKMVLPKAPVVYLSPQGKLLTQKKAGQWAEKGELILVCGRYAGIDQRVINQFIDEEISIGNYVLSGGELAALVVVDVVGRLVPGVLGNAESVRADSFMQGYLEAPLFTRPQNFNNQEIPQVLLSGDHLKIQLFQKWAGIFMTYLKRPELLKDFHWKLNLEEVKILEDLSDEDLRSLGTSRELLNEFIGFVRAENGI